MQGKGLARAGHMTGLHAQVTADGVHLVGFDVHAQFLQILEEGAPGEFVDPRFDFANVLLPGGIVFVLDVAHDLFQQIFDGDEARRAAVFIQGNGDMLLAGAKFLQKGADGLGFRYEEGFPHDGGKGLPVRIGGEQAAQNVLGMEDADHVVAGIPEDRDAGVP